MSSIYSPFKHPEASQPKSLSSIRKWPAELDIIKREISKKREVKILDFGAQQVTHTFCISPYAKTVVTYLENQETIDKLLKMKKGLLYDNIQVFKGSLIGDLSELDEFKG